jgi:hypothetical protein
MSINLCGLAPLREINPSPSSQNQKLKKIKNNFHCANTLRSSPQPLYQQNENKGGSK